MRTLVVFCSLFAISFAFSSSVVSASHSHHHAAAPAPGVQCSTLVGNMADCLSFVTPNNNLTKPDGSCCSSLKTVLKTNAECLCEAFKSSAQYGLTLNVTKALTLPSVCHLSAPSFSNCQLSATPASAPAPSNQAASPGFIAAGPNGLSPAPTAGNSGSSALTFSIMTIVFSVLAAYYCIFPRAS